MSLQVVKNCYVLFIHVISIQSVLFHSGQKMAGSALCSNISISLVDIYKVKRSQRHLFAAMENKRLGAPIDKMRTDDFSIIIKWQIKKLWFFKRRETFSAFSIVNDDLFDVLFELFRGKWISYWLIGHHTIQKKYNDIYWVSKRNKALESGILRPFSGWRYCFNEHFGEITDHVLQGKTHSDWNFWYYWTTNIIAKPL